MKFSKSITINKQSYQTVVSGTKTYALTDLATRNITGNVCAYTFAKSPMVRVENFNDAIIFWGARTVNFSSKTPTLSQKTVFVANYLGTLAIGNTLAEAQTIAERTFFLENRDKINKWMQDAAFELIRNAK